MLSIASLRSFHLPKFRESLTGVQTAKTNAPAIIAPEDCTKLFLYLPHDIIENGICSQLQNYILALHVAATFQRTLIVWDPVFEQADHPTSSILGCSSDHSASDQYVATGLSQILDSPSSQNHVCSSALCHNNHSEWTRLVSSSANDFSLVTCDTASVMVSGGRKLRRQYLQRLHQTPQQTNFTQWISSIGGVTPTQMEWFRQQQQQQQQQQQEEEDPWMGVAALLVPHVKWQPSLQPVIAHQIQTLQLPHNYTSMHIRRGDKLRREAKSLVGRYWASRGEENSNNHPNYIPLEAYVAQLHPGIDPPHIVIATDDPVTIRDEVERFEAAHDVYWKFHLLADHRVNYGHMKTEPDCHVRYNMTIDAIVDLEVMIRSQVFVGELNSNWGRFIHAMRTEFTRAQPVLRDFRVVFGNNKTRYPGQ